MADERRRVERVTQELEGRAPGPAVTEVVFKVV